MPVQPPQAYTEIPVAEDLIPVQNQGTIVNSERITVLPGAVSLLQNILLAQNLAMRIEALSFTVIPVVAVDYVEIDVTLPDQRKIGSNVTFFALRALGQNGLPLPSPGGGWLIPSNKLLQFVLRNLYTDPIVFQLHLHCSRYDANRLKLEGYMG